MGRRTMTKTQKIIVLFATFPIIAAVLYPPYYFIARDSDDKVEYIVRTGWDWILSVNKSKYDYVSGPRYFGHDLGTGLQPLDRLAPFLFSESSVTAR